MDLPELKMKAAEAALSLASERPWSEVTLSDVADRADIELAAFYGKLDLEDIVTAIDELLDVNVASERQDGEETLRERIFDAAMLRFEAMEDHRAALLSIRKSWKRQPVARLKAAKRRVKTAHWILTCAKADFAGVSARALVLSGILFRAENAWEKEDSPDFTRTMAQLDRDLRDVEDFARKMKGFGKTGPRKGDDASGGTEESAPTV